MQTIDEGGLLGERVNLWRNNRLWNIAESGYLIDGFETRPGMHPWQGEHLGKWLHAATLAYNVNGDEKLKKKLDEMAERLIATQLPNGYLGTYADEVTFMSMPENMSIKPVFDDVAEQKKSDSETKKKPSGGWDTWTHRYNLYGLLTYEKYFPNQRVIDACKKMGDLLIEYYGEGKYDLTKYGTRQGISATTLLESIVMLYERTSDKKYLDFAEHIVAVSDKNPKLRLMGAMLEKGSVVYSGDGKGYQLMANLLGYLRLYRSTNNKKYLQTVLNGWDEIYTKHLLVTGGPWTRQMPYNNNKECFAHTDAFHPEEILVEGCCDATWIQLNIHLFEFTGDAKYFNEAEITLLNSVYSHQYSDGIEWCYYTKPNESKPPFVTNFHCCGSSEPRGLEMFSSHLAGEINKNLSINTLFPSTIQLSKQFGGGNLKIEGNFPIDPSAKIHLNTKTDKNFTLEFRIPANTNLASVFVNGENIKTKTNERGFVELNHSVLGAINGGFNVNNSPGNQTVTFDNEAALDAGTDKVLKYSNTEHPVLFGEASYLTVFEDQLGLPRASSGAVDAGAWESGLTPSSVSVKTELLEKGFIIYTNVSDSSVRISAPEVVNGIVSIYSLLGQKIVDVEIRNGQGAFSSANIDSGVYIARIFASTISIAKKFIIG